MSGGYCSHGISYVNKKANYLIIDSYLRDFSTQLGVVGKQGFALNDENSPGELLAHEQAARFPPGPRAQPAPVRSVAAEASERRFRPSTPIFPYTMSWATVASTNGAGGTVGAPNTGTITLVTPTYLNALGNIFPVISKLQVHFIPEPGTAVAWCWVQQRGGCRPFSFPSAHRTHGQQGPSPPERPTPCESGAIAPRPPFKHQQPRGPPGSERGFRVVPGRRRRSCAASQPKDSRTALRLDFGQTGRLPRLQDPRGSFRRSGPGKRRLTRW